MSVIKKIVTNFRFRSFFLLIIILYIFYKITDGSGKLLTMISQVNFYYLIITLILVLTHTFLSVYVNMIIFNKFIKKKIVKIFFFYSFIKSQILSYVFLLVGIIYRYHIFRNKITLIEFFYINVFIFWFFLFFYIFLYSFELLILGYKFFPVNFYLFIFLIFLSFFVFVLPKILNILKSKFIIKPKKVVNKLLVFIYKKNIYSNFYSYLSNKLFFFGLLNHIISFFQIFFIFKMLDTPIPLNNLIFIFVINSFLDQLPVITPKNVGISEIIFGHIAESVGLNFDYGVLFKFFLRIFNLVSLLVLFLLIRFKNKLLIIKTLN